MSMPTKFKEMMMKYGKVALGVHFSVSAVSITGLYVAIKNNVDVESLFDKLHIPGVSKNKKNESLQENVEKDRVLIDESLKNEKLKEGLLTDQKKKRNGVAEVAASSGGALALALLCNKALFPVRVPITVVLTPPVARFLARRNMVGGVNGRV